jgi:mannose-6-phosphate isomerase class I
MSSKYDKLPAVKISGEIWKGWPVIIDVLKKRIKAGGKEKFVLAVETYQGVRHDELLPEFVKLSPRCTIDTRTLFYSEQKIREITYPYVTDDQIFGYLTMLDIHDFYDPEKLNFARQLVNGTDAGLILIYGYGASLICDQPDLLIWADMARWEIQKRMRSNEISNIGISNAADSFSDKYKTGFFVDWRICDRIKKQIGVKMDFILDSNRKGDPGMISGSTFFNGLVKASKQPFRVVPFFDPGPWGGQWMKNKFDLEKEEINYAWCFDCVPEENSLLFLINDEIFEIPSINLVLFQSENLLGSRVEARFGKEFPIRFDFLDTMEGGNLSFQVHPETDYIREKFGMPYTQDESYYILDAAPDGKVFLGLKKGIDRKAMKKELTLANEGNCMFEAEKYVNGFAAKKHDHFLIPAGTVHCSGKNCMVLEISATPYIFTFKMWDWGRNGLDGKPRPINLEHGFNNIRWERDTDFAIEQLVNKIEPVTGGEGWYEEKTGLHPNEFIETRRHWFTAPVLHRTKGSVNVLNLVEGEEAIIESPEGKFEPFVVHYAETFIIPACVETYTIRPYGHGEGKLIGTVKAYIR